MRGVEAQHRIAPLKEGSKSVCWRDPVDKSSRRLLPVGNVSNDRKMVKVNGFESQQSNESEIETIR